jgi:hypothetical protein
MKRCRHCLLPSAVPGSDIDAAGLCLPCRSHQAHDEAALERARLASLADLDATLEACRRSAEYDAIVCLSGGKDSLYLLHRLKVVHRLNILAFTVDANLPEVAWRNIRRTIERLGVDHLVYRPPSEFYRKLFAYLLRHQEPRGAVYTVSYVYAPLFEGDALSVATQRGIPLVFAGYSPGQPDRHRMVYEFPRPFIEKVDWTPPGLRDCGRFSDAEIARFWNPARFAVGTRFPRYIAPFHAWEYDQNEVMNATVELGLVERRRHASPVLSNYPVNWLLMYSDLRNLGYNPYAPEFSALIRNGKASLSYWKAMAPLVDWMIRSRMLLGRNVTRQLAWLELDEDDLKIDQPLGAYDPPQAN